MKLDCFFILLFSFLSGCAPESAKNVIKIAVHTESEGQMSDYFQKAQAVFLETNDHALILAIDKVIVMVQDVSADSDKKELILLASVPLKLMFFDFQGKLKRKYELQEELRFQNITVDKNRILARYLSDSDVLPLWRDFIC